jgi:hypothetical protein
MNHRENSKNDRAKQVRPARILAGIRSAFSSQPTPKLLRITRTVEYRQNGECSVCDRKVYVVAGKPLQTNLPSLSANPWETFRISLRALQSTIYFKTELFAQTGALLFVPSSRLGQFIPCSGLENELKAHFQPKRCFISALTCSQGIPSSGLASNSAIRRSSSAASSGVKSGSYPSSTMISQKSCASLILSSLGSAFAASRISVAFIPVIYRDGLGLRTDSRTCCHGMPSSGLRLNRSARRSASSICSGVKPSSRSPNSSKICPATSRRSFSGKRRICSKISVALTNLIYRDCLKLQSEISARASLTRPIQP